MQIQQWAPKVYVPLLAIHLAVLIVEPAQVLTWSYALVLCVLALTLFLCWRRLRLSVKHNRPLWSLLLLALCLRATSFGLLFVDSLHNPEGSLVAFDPTFYFCLGSLVLTIAAAYNPVSALYRWGSVIDGVLVCAIAWLFYALLSSVMTAPAALMPSATFIMWTFDAMAVFVATFVSLRFVATRRADERRFYFVLMAFCWAELLFPAIHNRFILSSESYVPELCLDVPFVVLGMLLSRRRTVWLRGYRPRRRYRALVNSITPFVLSLALCLLALLHLPRHPVIAISAVILGIASYAARVVIVLGRHLALENELKKLQRGLRRAANQDDLTQLTNRRGFFRVMTREWESLRDAPPTLTVALVDIDLFKAFNDTYGHIAGDDCLAAVARALDKASKSMPNVLVARYGGEEFAVLMTGHDRNHAALVLERMRAGVEALQIQHRRSPFGVVTISAGLASTADVGRRDIEKWLEAADLALYAAKDAGRNRVQAYTAGMTAHAAEEHRPA